MSNENVGNGTPTSEATILHGNSLETLKTLPDNSIDACVTDPPYGLSKEPNIAEVMQHWLNGDQYTHNSKGFMGKTWDSFVPGPEYWREVYRVLKPGGHLLAFSGTRTYDLMAVAIRFAGFEIRDQIQWLYGSGFPKSLDVSKAIDKAVGAEREVIGHNPKWNTKPRAMAPGEADRQAVPAYTAPATDDAKRWQGYGTALKPANEPIVLARKPLEKGLTVAENVLKYGTGSLNIDASRISTDEQVTCTRTVDGISAAGYAEVNREKNYSMPAQGRWPANLILDESAAEMLDEQSGVLAGAGNKSTREEHKDSESIFGMGGRAPTKLYDRGGGASRFFYVAKASKRERNAGCEVNGHPTVKPVKLMEYLVRMITPPGGTCLDPFMGSGTTGVACKRLGFNFIGCELSDEYIEIAIARIKAAGQVDTTPDETEEDAG